MNTSNYLGFSKYPRALDIDPKYKNLPISAKMLYIKLYNRHLLSVRPDSNYCDDNGVYVIYTIREACNTLNCGKDTAIKAFQLLESVGLIRRRKVGYSNPYRIYVTDIMGRPDNSTYTPPDLPINNDRANQPVLIDRVAPIYTDISNTNVNNINTDTTSDEQAQIIDLIQQLFYAYPEHRRQTISDITRVIDDLALTIDDLRLALSNLVLYTQSVYWRNDDGRYVPNVTKWLRQSMWRNPPKGPRTDGRRELDNSELDAIMRMMADTDYL